MNYCILILKNTEKEMNLYELLRLMNEYVQKTENKTLKEKLDEVENK